MIVTESKLQYEGNMMGPRFSWNLRQASVRMRLVLPLPLSPATTIRTMASLPLTSGIETW